MPRSAVLMLVTPMLIILAVYNLQAQRGGGNWSTIGSDAQRTAWSRTDAKVSADTIQKSGFRFLWRMKLDNQARQLNSLTQPLLLQNIISYKGFKALAFVGGSSDKVYAIDYDLSKIFWTRHLDTASTLTANSLQCPGGLTAITRAVAFAQPARGGRGGGGGGGGGGGNNPLANAVFVVSSGGMVHALNPQTGEDLRPPVRLLQPNSKVVGSIVADNVLYAATTDNCGGTDNGVWAVDLRSDTTTVAAWKTLGARVAGSAGLAVGSDGTIYVATGSGAAGNPNSIVALEPGTLQLKDFFTAKTPFVSSPIVFPFMGKDLVAATNSDGRLYVLDSTSVGGSDHRTPLMTSIQYAPATEFATEALATWEDSAGTRWILAPSAGPFRTEAKVPMTNGNVSNGAIIALKIVDKAGLPAFEPGWVSRDMVSPLPPMILNNVVFAISSGEYRTADNRVSAAQRAQRSQPAVLYALDGATGRELWSSGQAITSFARGEGPSGGDSQVYVGTHDGTLYAFGVPLEH